MDWVSIRVVDISLVRDIRLGMDIVELLLVLMMLDRSARDGFKSMR